MPGDMCILVYLWSLIGKRFIVWIKLSDLNIFSKLECNCQRKLSTSIDIVVLPQVRLTINEPTFTFHFSNHFRNRIWNKVWFLRTMRLYVIMCLNIAYTKVSLWRLLPSLQRCSAAIKTQYQLCFHPCQLWFLYCSINKVWGDQNPAKSDVKLIMSTRRCRKLFRALFDAGLSPSNSLCKTLFLTLVSIAFQMFVFSFWN